MIALALIVKGSDAEAVLLDRCLSNVAPYVDRIFITSTHKKGEQPNKQVEKIAKLHKATLSTFEWCNDFAKARNFNFSQVPKDYDYILWCDADDVFRGLEKLKPTIEDNPTVDVFAFWYMYDFDQYKLPTVVHKKSQLVKNDGCVHWEGKLHEDFVENRALNTKFVEGIERLHLTTEERVLIAKDRNIEVAKGDTEENPKDPRSWWNLGNSYLGNGNYKEAKECFVKFLLMSQSDDEKYLVRMRLGAIEKHLGNFDASKEQMYMAIGMKPEFPDAFLSLGQFFSDYNDVDKAESYLLQGLIRKPKYHGIIVYNPRDYDYNPMMLLANVYFRKNRPDLALPLLKGCMKIYPEHDYLKVVVADMEKEKIRLEDVVKLAEVLEKIENDDVFLQEIAKIPKDLRSHPAICSLRNKRIIKTTSSGKDIAYFCGFTEHVWNPKLFKTKGFGGSEEAVINLSKQWAKAGYNVTVFNNCGHEEMKADGVVYKPFWEFNSRDKYDALVIWRHPRMLDYDVNATKVLVDMHDVIPKGEFTEKRLEKITKVLFKTKFHRSLFPDIPDEKSEILPNGVDLSLFTESQKDQYLMVNTSSPDRSMDVMPKLFKKIKERVPQARMQWAYGWDIFDSSHESNSEMMKWRHDLQKEIDEAGIESLGKIPQSECAKLYMEGNVLAYPSEFAEIDCISVKKAQAAGCMPVTTDFGALDESVQHGIKIHSDKTKDTWAKDYQISFGLDDEAKQNEWIDAVVKVLQTPIEDRSEMKTWAKNFDWKLISNKWLCLF